MKKISRKQFLRAAAVTVLGGAGNWQEGQRFHSSASDADVSEWVKELGL